MKTKNIGYVITEVTMESSDAEVVGKTKSGKPIVEVILQDMNVDNRNGRYYADKDLVPELTSARMQELISSGNMKGENGHPISKDNLLLILITFVLKFLNYGWMEMILKHGLQELTTKKVKNLLQIYWTGKNHHSL